MKLRFAVFFIIVVGMLIPTEVFTQKKGARIGYKSSGFSYIPETGIYLPSNIYHMGFNIQNSFGIQAGSHFFLGAGFGLDVYESDLLIPAYLDIRWYPIEGAYSPIFAINAGYALGLEDNLGGIMYHPRVGLRYWLDKKVAIHGTLGYKIQYVPLGFTGPAEGVVQSNKQVSCFSIQMGMQF